MLLHQHLIQVFLWCTLQQSGELKVFWYRSWYLKSFSSNCVSGCMKSICLTACMFFSSILFSSPIFIQVVMCYYGYISYKYDDIYWTRKKKKRVFNIFPVLKVPWLWCFIKPELFGIAFLSLFVVMQQNINCFSFNFGTLGLTPNSHPQILK